MAELTATRRAETLVGPDWLWERRDDPDVLPIGSSYEGFALGHIPGVVLPVFAWLKDAQVGPGIIPAAEFARVMEDLGVTERTTVVAYDDFDGTLAARLWWVLLYFGHDAVRYLDGGWHRWVLEERTLSMQQRPHSRGRFVPSIREEMACSTDELLELVREGRATVVDVRALDEWEGSDANVFGNKRQGHIPGSLHLDPATLITEELRTIRPAAELTSLLDEAGVPESGRIVFSCQAGVAASFGVLVLDVLGRAEGVVYEASMAEWANRDDTPMSCGD